MESIEKWADRIYAETDFGKSVATSLAGSVGLVIYLLAKDWVVAVFSSIIIFPVFRIIASGLNEKYRKMSERKLKEERARYLFEKLSPEELEVVRSFVTAGGTSLTFRVMNNLPIQSAAIEAMIQRELIWTSVMADGMTESFVLDVDIFDLGAELYASAG